MSTFLWIMLASLGGSVLSAAAAGTYLLLPERVRDHTLTYLVSFAIGMLLGAGFLHLLPEALEQRGDNIQGLMATALLAIVLFFLLEKGLVWRHHHHQEHGSGEACHEAPAGTLILVGDSFHNFLDGVLIAASFTADFHLGVVTSLAIIAHEIPQELGDFAILLHSGYTPKRAFTFNLITSLTMIVGATLAWFAMEAVRSVIPYFLAFTAASFIYIAVSDLMPTLNRKIGLRDTIIQVSLISLGLALNFLVHD
ncbi:MAG: ZIP family metal transporter [Proteobacteria bacterium]|nr:ZIP family metal transporter [Pseudomonadota bacterium]MBK8957571.1 ZIP family metal transporter [Pseudomonadota bacterium]